MTAQDDPYVRVYYRVLTDAKFTDLSHAAWGHWVRLLVVADGLYPAPAPLPRWVDDAALTELAAAGIVDLLGSDYFTVHGMKAEREGRSEAATFAADVKHHGRSEAERRRSDRMRAHAGAVQPDAGAAPGAAGGPPGLPLRSSPLLAAPIQSAPLRSASAGTTNVKDITTKKKPEDEQLMDDRLREYRDPATPPWKRETLRQWLSDQGVRDPDAVAA